MLDMLKNEAMKRGMQLLSNPKVAKMVSDPRVIGTVMKGLALKGRIQSEVNGHVRTVASMLNLATKDDLDTLQQTVRQVVARCCRTAAQPFDRFSGSHRSETGETGCGCNADADKNGGHDCATHN